MAVRIAAASSDGKVINQHFGAAQRFLVFEVDAAGAHFIEIRENAPPCHQGEHSDSMLLQSVALIADCKVILVSKIGPVAKSHLSLEGIEAIECGDFIEDTISRMIKSKYFTNKYLSKK